MSLSTDPGWMQLSRFPFGYFLAQSLGESLNPGLCRRIDAFAKRFKLR
jgi:hypothetical protein